MLEWIRKMISRLSPFEGSYRAPRSPLERVVDYILGADECPLEPVDEKDKKKFG